MMTMISSIWFWRENVINLFHYVLFWSLCVRYTGWLAWASTVLRRLALCPLFAFRYLKGIYWLFQTAVWCIDWLCVCVCVWKGSMFAYAWYHVTFAYTGCACVCFFMGEIDQAQWLQCGQWQWADLSSADMWHWHTSLTPCSIPIRACLSGNRGESDGSETNLTRSLSQSNIAG